MVGLKFQTKRSIFPIRTQGRRLRPEKKRCNIKFKNEIFVKNCEIHENCDMCNIYKIKYATKNARAELADLKDPVLDKVSRINICIFLTILVGIVSESLVVDL